MTCNCKMCTDVAKWKTLDPEVAFNEMLWRIESAEADVAYYKAILHGQ